MALVLDDRVKETSTTTGTGTYSLAGAVTGFQTFVAGIGDTNTTYYCATDGTDWEVGLGTVTDATPDTLARTTVLSSSNSDAAVSWAAGTRSIFCCQPASKAVYLDASGNPVITITESQISDLQSYYVPGGTDVALADGGTGASLSDPNADRIMFWDDSAGAVTWLTVGTNLTITDTTIAAGGGGWTQIGSTLTTTGAGPWAFTSIPATYEDLLVLINVTNDGTSSSLLLNISDDNGTTYSGNFPLTGSGSNKTWKGGAFIPNYQGLFGIVTGGCGDDAGTAPYIDLPSNTNRLYAWYTDAAIDALRVALSGGNLSATSISLYGR